jgi:hypothetical protein
MELCTEIKRRHGTCIAFVNAVWQDNSRVLGKHLSSFDYVSMRESRSAEQARKWTDKVATVPDLVFSAIETNQMPGPPEGQTRCVVTDCVVRHRADALHDFASFHRLPFYLMSPAHLREYVRDPEKVYRVARQIYPQLIADMNLFATVPSCVTGRFHAVVACLAHGVPFAAVASNTHKIESLLEDIGLGNRYLLPEKWGSLGNFERFDVVQELLGNWDRKEQQKVARYTASARQVIDQSFEDIQRLVHSSRPKRLFKLFAGRGSKRRAG